MSRRFLLFVLCLQLCACESLAIWTTARKQALFAHDESSQHAEQYFWQTLHAGDYRNIDAAIRLLMIAYLKNPNDPRLAAHLGFLHTWKITERDQDKPNPRIPDEIILARKYFTDAVALESKNPIYQGFLGDTELVEGQIFADERQQIRGYFQLKRAISAWPQFNYFTAGYPMSSLPAQSAHFKEGLNWQWLTLDLCAGQSVNRQHPDFRPFMNKETTKGPNRACWNSWIAPYNFEGFFLNMGDMLVKAGQWQLAIEVYKNAQLDKNYAQWPFRKLLAERIEHARENVASFQKDNNRIMFNSGVGCQVCHRKTALSG